MYSCLSHFSIGKEKHFELSYQRKKCTINIRPMLLTEVVATALQPLKDETLGVNYDTAKSNNRKHGEKFQRFNLQSLLV